MLRNINNIFALLLITIITMGSKCRKDDDDIKSYQYNFLEPINLYPYKNTYQIGDTIFLEYHRNSKVLFDEDSNREVEIDSVNFEFRFLLRGFPGLQNSPSDDYYGLILPNRSYSSYDRDKKLTQINIQSGGCTTNKSNNFKAGIILRKAGTFALELQHSASNAASCVMIRHDGFLSGLIRFRFTLSNLNKDIYHTIPEAFRCSSCDKFIDDKEMFVFKVE